MPCRLAFDQELMIVLKSLRIQNFIFVLAVVALTVGACGGGDDKGGLQLSKNGQISFDYSQAPNPTSGTIEVKSGEVSAGESASYTVQILNTGDGLLTIDNVSVEYSAPNVPVDGVQTPVDEASGPSFSLSKGFINGLEMAPSGGVMGGMMIAPADSGSSWCEDSGYADTECTRDSVDVVVQFKRYDDAHVREATLIIESDTLKSSEQKWQISFVTVAGLPVANVSPKLLEFGQVNKGDSPVKHITVSNTGSDELLIYQVLFQAQTDYSLIFDTQSWKPADLDPNNPRITFAEPVAVAPNEATIFSVQFTPQNADAATGSLVFFSNDPTQPSGTKVDLKANEQGPCIKVNPKKVQFGGKLVSVKSVLPVEIISCGTSPLSVTNIQLTEGSDADFALNTTSLVGFEDGTPVSVDNPLEIPVNLTATLNVEYVPSQESPLGQDGQPVFDIGSILIESNAFEASLEVEVSGLGVTKECPTAVGVILEGQEVIPQTVLHLFGDQSFAPAGEIASWKWTVNQPTGSASVFVPSDTFPNPTFEANTAGTYEFMLEVWDVTGVKSCTPWVQEVAVLPDEAIHVELLWTTPNDPDETDEGPEAGSDVDLHFVHNLYAKSGPDLDNDGAPDPWFDQPFDCFWFNAHPNWGSFDPSVDDDPGLDRDDTDGAGPENMNLNIPENGATYRVGVHYWSDHEYGPSYSTVRIYIWGVLVFEVKDVKLVNHDMWDVATIEWPSAKVSLVQTGDGGYKITPDYQNPFFFQP